MEPTQFMNLIQMIGYSLGTIDAMEKRCEPGSQEYMNLEEISDQLIDMSKYVKHCALCPCNDIEPDVDEPGDLDDEL